MEQLVLFNEFNTSELVIPVDVISPLESKNSVKSKEFKCQQQRWSNYVSAIQEAQGCSWFEARELLICHRDKQVAIKVQL